MVKIKEVSEVANGDGNDRSGPKRYRRGRFVPVGKPRTEVTPLTETAARAMSRNKRRREGEKSSRREEK